MPPGRAIVEIGLKDKGLDIGLVVGTSGINQCIVSGVRCYQNKQAPRLVETRQSFKQQNFLQPRAVLVSFSACFGLF